MKILFLLVMSYLFFSVQAKNIEVSYFYSNLPPYEFVDKNGKAAGIGITHINAILTEAELKGNYHYYSVNKGLHLLRQGKVDFSAVISPNTSIYKDFLVSKLPIYSIVLGVIRQKTTQQISNVAQLNQHNFAALKETSFLFNKIASVLQQKNRYNVDSFAQGVHLVNVNKLPYFLTYKHSKQPLASTLLFDVLITEPVYLIISKKHPQAKTLMQKIDQAISTITFK